MPVDDESAALRRFEVLTMRGKTPMYVTRDGLIVEHKPGQVFSLSDARLGEWTLNGSALHLQGDRKRFVLGGLDHRIVTGTRLDVPPVEHTDATMRASDFDELLTMVARRSGSDVRQPAPGEPIRCVLTPNTSAAWTDYVMPWRDFAQRRRRKKLPSLSIDVGKDAIWVTDMDTHAAIASASVAQVTAAARNYPLELTGPARWLEQISALLEGDAVADGTTPVLVVDIPGLQPLTIGSPVLHASIACRFTWLTTRGIVPGTKSPDYLVSGADWLVLVEKFGLAPLLARTAYDPGF
jgi:hypothetical protein